MTGRLLMSSGVTISNNCSTTRVYWAGSSRRGREGGAGGTLLVCRDTITARGHGECVRACGIHVDHTSRPQGRLGAYERRIDVRPRAAGFIVSLHAARRLPQVSSPSSCRAATVVELETALQVREGT